MTPRTLTLMLVAWLLPGVVSACPMCAETIAGDPNLPQAFMVSILFMLATPAIVLGVLGGLVVRAVRAADAAHEAVLTPIPVPVREANQS